MEKKENPIIEEVESTVNIPDFRTFLQVIFSAKRRPKDLIRYIDELKRWVIEEWEMTPLQRRTGEMQEEILKYYKEKEGKK